MCVTAVDLAVPPLAVILHHMIGLQLEDVSGGINVQLCLVQLSKHFLCACNGLPGNLNWVLRSFRCLGTQVQSSCRCSTCLRRVLMELMQPELMLSIRAALPAVSNIP